MPLSPKLLETLREYWRWMHPRPICFRERKMVGEPINRSHPKCSGRLAGKRRKQPASRKTIDRIYYATMPLPKLCRLLFCGPLLMGLKRFYWRHSSRLVVATLEGW